jgi:protein-S-isoprenylcysteine O-methyltransferase Ste14
MIQSMDNRTGVPFPPPLIPLGAIGAGALFNLWIPHWPLGVPWMIAGGLIFAAGAACVAWSFRLMKIHRTTGSPFGAATTLLAAGPYRFSRNPIYLSILVIQGAVALVFGLAGTLALLPVSWWLLNRFIIPREEAFLRTAFPKEFADYSARVRRWI